jgi:hypothetical protein
VLLFNLLSSNALALKWLIVEPALAEYPLSGIAFGWIHLLGLQLCLYPCVFSTSGVTRQVGR